MLGSPRALVKDQKSQGKGEICGSRPCFKELKAATSLRAPVKPVQANACLLFAATHNHLQYKEKVSRLTWQLNSWLSRLSHFLQKRPLVRE